jgi:hypothetical protein
MKPSFKQSFKIKNFLLIHRKAPPGKFRLPKRRRSLFLITNHNIFFQKKSNDKWGQYLIPSCQ